MSGSFESTQWNVCVHRLDLGLHSHPKEFWGNGVRTHVNSKGKIPSTGKILPRGGWNPQRCIAQNREPNTQPTSYSGPMSFFNQYQYPISECHYLYSANTVAYPTHLHRTVTSEIVLEKQKEQETALPYYIWISMNIKSSFFLQYLFKKIA